MDAAPHDKERRAAPLDAFGPDPFAATAFGDLSRTAADLLGAPMAALSVRDGSGDHLKAVVGIPGGQRSVDAFAAWALCQPARILVVEDAGKDPEMQKALSEAGLANVGFYAAVPLTLSSGEAIGALCVMGGLPRTVSTSVMDQLKFLADQVIRTLEERHRNRG